MTRMHHFRADAERIHEYCKEALLSGLCSNPDDHKLFSPLDAESSVRQLRNIAWHPTLHSCALHWMY
jgi:hypothetical protein